MASDCLFGCYGDCAGGNDIIHLSIRQVGEVKRRSGEGLLEQDKANASEVEVFGNTGGVSGPRGEAVGVGGGGAEKGQVTLTGTTSPVGRRDLWGGAK